MICESATASDEDAFERDLYLIRRRIEKQAIAGADPGFLHLLAVVPLDHLQGHVPGRAARRASIPTCSTSASSRASRSSTSAIRPTPSRPGGWRSRSACSPTTARSTRCSGNVNWMKSHETRMARRRLRRRIVEDMKPVIQAGGSDTAALDNVFEVLVPRRPRRADGQDAADPRGLGQRPRPCRRRTATCSCLLQRGDGAVGRAGGARRDRRPLGDRRHGPQRAAAAALRHHRRRPADRRLRDRHGAARRERRSSRRAASARAR